MTIARHTGFRGGLVVALALAMAAVPAGARGGTRQINFDDQPAPCCFAGQPPLSTHYQAVGVVFSGPAPGLGGRVLDQSGGFGVSGHSPPNFLAFNPAGEPTATGPETITFTPPAHSVQIKEGTGTSGGIGTLTAYNGSEIVAESSRNVGSAMTVLQVAASRITSVRVDGTSSSYVLDDLVWGSLPVATGDDYAAMAATPLTTASPGVLGNDSDPDGDPITAELQNTARHGDVDLRAAGDFTYTPDPGFTGQDTFTYMAVGGGARSDPAAVRINVAPDTSACSAALAAVKAAKAKVRKAKKALARARASGDRGKIKRAQKALHRAKQKLKRRKAELAERC